MLQEGLLSRSENSPRYKVGNLLFEISRLYKLASSLIDVVDEAVKAISRDTGHTGYVSILDGADVLVIRMHQGSHGLRVFTPLGQRAPAFATAIGRSLLARLSDDAVRALHAEGFVPPSTNAPQNTDDLLRALEQPRRFGWAEAVDEAIPGVGSISVSVADPEIGETVGFCISYPASQIGEEERSRIITLLSAAVHRIAHRFGDPFLAQHEQLLLRGSAAA
jgi:IclR family transcriptional regulator, KDG regulon repressor